MSNARDYVLAIGSDGAAAVEIAQSTSEALQSRKTTLIDVVKSLGEYINDEDEKIRARAISYLTAVLSNLPQGFLSRQQIQVLCQFLSDRIEDGGAIDGLSELQGVDKFTNDMAQIVVRAIFEHFTDLQSRPQSARYRILQLLNEIMVNHRKGLRDMGDESLVGITTLVSGEKDPRNLMLVFSMLRAIMVEWDISNHAEVMFDSVYAYFPITFRPPPNDPYGITAQDLKDRLKDCLSSTNALAPYVIPNLLDKLDSVSPAVKKDVLQALAACATHYETGSMAQYSITLWDALKYEVLTASEPDLANETLQALKSIATCLSKSNNTSPTSSPLVQYLKPINKECIEHLQEPAQRQAKASADILRSVSSASTTAFALVVKAVIPALLVVYQSAEGILNQRATLECFNQLFDSAKVLFGTWEASSDRGALDENPLFQFKDTFLAMYSQALMGTVKEEVSFRIMAAKGLLLLSSIWSFLEDNEIGLFVQHLDEIVLTEESYGRDELKTVATNSLADISRYKPRLIMDITFPAFLAKLPDSEEAASRAKDLHTTLEGLAEISLEKVLLETLIRRLLNKFDGLLQTSDPISYNYASALLSTVYYVLNRDSTPAAIYELYFERLVIGLSMRARAAAVSRQDSVLTNDVVLDILGRINNLIIRKSPQNRLGRVCDNVYTLFDETATNPGPRSVLARGGHNQSMILSTWLLAAMPANFDSLSLSSREISANIDQLLRLVYNPSSSALQLTYLRQISLYINKHIPTKQLNIANIILMELTPSLSSNVSQNNPTEIHLATAGVQLVFTISKALILRLAPNTNKLLEDLVSLLDVSRFPPHIRSTAAARFGGLLSSDDVLSKTNFAQIRLLAPQRVFQVLTPLISDKFKSATSSEEKESYLTALSGIISTIPSEIVMPELPTLLPLLLQSLDISEQSVKIATLETIAVVIANSPSSLEESGHIPALAKRLLLTAQIQPSDDKQKGPTNLPKTRRLAVRCVTLMPTRITGGGTRSNPLLELKREVLRGLMKILDDPRRDVRKEAVNARSAWLRGVDDIKNDDEDD